jgi:hypothetical protein
MGNSCGPLTTGLRELRPSHPPDSASNGDLPAIDIENISDLELDETSSEYEKVKARWLRVFRKIDGIADTFDITPNAL